MNNYKTASVHGKAFEDLTETMLDNVKIPHRKEQTLSSGKRRRKDKGSDFELYPEDNPLFLECKSMDHNSSLTYSVWDDGRHTILKWFQIKNMDYLFIEVRYVMHKEHYLASKTDFIKWACVRSKNSFNAKDVKEFAHRVTDLSELVR